jgi:hypothetical protein
MSILKFTTGRKGASGKNAGYITRESACDAISFHNLDELEGKTQYESRVNAVSYAHNREEEETEINGRGRTHYRAILSWEGKEETERAREMTHEYLNKNFEGSRAIVAIHQDTEHTHAHVWIDARQLDDKKLHISKRDFEQIRDDWTRQYDRTYNTEFEKEYQAKYEQTKNWNREQAEKGKEIGKQPRPESKPERAEMTTEQWREKDERDKGVKTIDKEGFRGNQRPLEVRNSSVKEAEQTIDRSREQLEQGERAIGRVEQTASGAIRETKELRRSVEEYSRTVNEKVAHQEKGTER